MGPTAAGKTAAALALCRRFPVGLISVDSAQVYRHLNIGAAKPDRQTLKRFPHALINVRDPEDSYSVADFVADAESEIRSEEHTSELQSRGHLVCRLLLEKK